VEGGRVISYNGVLATYSLVMIEQDINWMEWFLKTNWPRMDQRQKEKVKKIIEKYEKHDNR